MEDVTEMRNVTIFMLEHVNVEVKEPHDEVGDYECAGCKSSWNDERYIVKH